MAITPQVFSPQARVLVGARRPTPFLELPQGRVLATINFPSRNVAASQARVLATSRRPAMVEAVQARVLALGRGKVSTPNLKAWTYTLDGHDFYVLRLGTEKKTLVLDISTGQWSWFASDDLRWRANTGFNWRSSGKIPAMKGSNVVVGDDSLPIIWVLDPLYGQDDSTILGSTPIPFERMATGQIPTDAREKPPVYQVYLSGSLGDPALTANTVSLSYSDDQGRTYINAGDRTVQSGNYYQEFAWRSLGLAGNKKNMGSLGRLLRVTDNGAFARIDSLDVL